MLAQAMSITTATAPQQRQERRPGVAYHQILTREQPDAVFLLGGMRLPDPSRDCVHLALGLLETDAWLETGDDLEIAGVPHR